MPRPGVVAGGSGRQRGGIAGLVYSQLIQTGEDAPTCALCSGECSNGETSWRVNWSTEHPTKLHGTNIQCQNWRSLRVIPSADNSVTFFGEATGTGESS